MAVTIDELHVDVEEPPSQAAPAPSGAPHDKLDLRSALETLRERALRLRAD